ncbi:MAG: PilZ domain-containing protein [Candidatus Omnitrophica bacterium]|nr:PilZ domain-containing protein [Candidatus Omnitrophota bacterium]
MILIFELLLIVVLISILATLFVTENKTKRTREPSGEAREYWGPEKREHVRFDVPLPVHYHSNERSDNRHKVMTKNISLGGLNVVVMEKLLPGATLHLEVDIPTKKHPFTCTTEVVWSKPLPQEDRSKNREFETGVKFVQMGKADKAVLEGFISHLTERGESENGK